LGGEKVKGINVRLREREEYSWPKVILLQEFQVMGFKLVFLIFMVVYWGWVFPWIARRLLYFSPFVILFLHLGNHVGMVMLFFFWEKIVSCCMEGFVGYFGIDYFLSFLLSCKLEMMGIYNSMNEFYLPWNYSFGVWYFVVLACWVCY